MKQSKLSPFKVLRKSKLSLLLLLMSGVNASLASEEVGVAPGAKGVEVLHWWTSGGEAQSAEILKNAIEQDGYTWNDFSVAGGGGESAMMVLKARAVSGNPPTSAQIKGYDIKEWSQLGFLRSIDDVAQTEHWDELLPEVVSRTVKYKGKYVAAPVNVHRVNQLWINAPLFKKLSLPVPKTLDEFFLVAETIKAAGYIPLAHGSEAWQNVTLFDVVAMAVLDAEDYYKAFVELDSATLSGDKMVEVFATFQRMRNYIDDKALGRDWNVATKMVIDGTAAMQIMGDWAKGEFNVAGKVPGEDYLCVAAPGTEDTFGYNIDSFVFFKTHDPSNVSGQKDVAKVIMSDSFQEAFNYSKGSLPARTDISLEGFDLCAQNSMKAFKRAEGTPDMLPSLSADMSTTSYVKNAVMDVVNEFFNDENASPEAAAKRLARVVKAAM
ncbi:ABC transporter substrate-binding protein [Vibrio sp. JC009]|uniref:ABC transporter substrate-binding protein n=1 Tax=Vibrio sp. JC009 TaxID=2912314 RepID=UPI0023B0F722|nr:ABC transporter substrate-binding protein [Vibrio sp. JC009]WED20932.1 ABC transporter substrate-binding protein [Vibrio sp. JC009]